jgi:outer membrane lipoprotein-sorting protein
VAVTASNRTVVAGSNGLAGWVHIEESGLTRVVNLSDGSGAWSVAGATGAPLGGGVGATGAAIAGVRERYEELVPEGWNATRGALPSNLTEGVSGLNLTEGVSGLNLTEELSGVNLTDEVSSLNVTDEVSGLNVTDRASDLNLTDEVSGLNLTDSAYADYASEGWNGSQVWNLSAMEMVWNGALENVTTERLGSETVDGTEAHLVEVEATDDRNGTLRVWIGTEEATILKSQFARENLTVTVQYTDVRFNTSIGDSTFRPPGAGPAENQMVDSRGELQTETAFAVPVPSEAYTLTEGSTVTYGGVTAAIGSYTGPANATVVATTADNLPIDASAAGAANATEVDLSGETATVADTDRGVVVSWEADGVRTAVISEDSREAAISVAESITAGE